MKKILLFLFIVSLVFCACSRGELDPQEPVKGVVELTAVIEESKTSLDGLDVKWTEGDQICVFSSDGSQKGRFYLDDGAGSTTAKFRGDMALSTGTYYALYPYSDAASVSSDTLRFLVSDVQNYSSSNSFANGANPMLATFTVGDDGKPAKLQFKNLFSVVQVLLKGNCKVGSVQFAGKSGTNILWGTASCNLNDMSIKMSNTTGDAHKHAITLKMTKDQLVTLDGSSATAFYICVPPMELNSEISVGAGTHKDEYPVHFYEKTKSTGVSLTLERNKIQPIDAGKIGDITVLSYDEYANCYIVPSGTTPKTYAIRTVNPDGVALGPSSCELLWETKNTTTAPTQNDIVNNLSYNKGYITFAATGTSGNALIAAKKSTDIVWSWHIWVPSTTVDDQDYSTNKVMDRNLGALTATGGDVTSNGLLYQYGRKDPFMGSASYSENKAAACYPSTAFDEMGTAAISNTDVIKIPKKFIKVSGDWCSDTNGSKYNWIDKDNTATKTIYDPCPPGYRVAHKDIWNTSDFAYSTGNNHYTYNSTYIYPFTGCLTNDTGVRSNYSNGYLWSRIYSDSQSYRLKYITASSKDVSITYMPRAYGFAVRCQKL